MKLKTARAISKIKAISMAVKRVRRRVISKGAVQMVGLCGGPFDGAYIPMQACCYGTLRFRLGHVVGRYDQKNQWSEE